MVLFESFIKERRDKIETQMRLFGISVPTDDEAPAIITDDVKGDLEDFELGDLSSWKDVVGVGARSSR